LGLCLPQPVSVLGYAPSSSLSYRQVQAHFEPKRFPYKFPKNPIALI
jgi:hypothetical protein